MRRRASVSVLRCPATTFSLPGSVRSTARVPTAWLMMRRRLPSREASHSGEFAESKKSPARCATNTRPRSPGAPPSGGKRPAGRTGEGLLTWTATRRTNCAGAENTFPAVAAPESLAVFLRPSSESGVRRIQDPRGEEARRSGTGFQLPAPAPIVGRGPKGHTGAIYESLEKPIGRRNRSARNAGGLPICRSRRNALGSSSASPPADGRRL